MRHLKRELAQIEEKKEQFTADLDDAAARIRKTLRELVDGAPGIQRREKSRRRSKTKRVRRNPEQLKQEAESIFRLIKSNSESGTKGGEIRQRHPKVGPNIKSFVENYGGHKVKTSGKKAAMRYFPA